MTPHAILASELRWKGADPSSQDVADTLAAAPWQPDPVRPPETDYEPGTYVSSLTFRRDASGQWTSTSTPVEPRRFDDDDELDVLAVCMAASFLAGVLLVGLGVLAVRRVWR